MKKETKLIIGIVMIVVFIATIFFNLRKPTTTADATKCMVTLFGQQYDVTQFRKIHQGGDVFICGTDMTQAYQQQHGSDVSRIRQFLN